MKKLPFSKALVLVAVVVSIVFVVWCCFEMHVQRNLEPVAYIGPSIVGMLTVVLSGYMWRAKQSDLYDLEIKRMQHFGNNPKKVPVVPEDFSGDNNDYDIMFDEGGGEL